MASSDSGRVGTSPQNVNATKTHEDVLVWLESMRDRGIFDASTMRNRASALTQLVAILGEDEPRGAEWLLENIDPIGHRWAVRNHARPDTAATYAGRARAALKDFLAYHEDMKRWERERHATRERGKGAKPSKTTRPESPGAGHLRDASAPASTSATPSSAPSMHSIPIGPNRDFAFRLPGDGFTKADVRRIACALLNLASDYDPVVDSPVNLFAPSREAA